jgi:hypothetical protein
MGYQASAWGSGVKSFSLTLLIFHESFPSYPRLFSSKNEEISAPPPCGFLIGIYLFYENWSTETSRKNESNRWAFYYTKPANLLINLDWRLLLRRAYRRAKPKNHAFS